MNAKKAVNSVLHGFALFGDERQEVADLIQRQQREINNLKKQIGCKYCKNREDCSQYRLNGGCEIWEECEND